MAGSIVPLVVLWEEFVKEDNSGDIHQFARWILQKDTTKPDSGLLKEGFTRGKSSPKNIDDDLADSSKALMYISRLHKYMQMKSKPVIKKLGFGKDHEYLMLTYIYLLKEPNKKELAKKMLLENSTTVEISNRLVKRGYLKETTDEIDKRSTRLSLTDKGEQKLFESYGYMEKSYAGFLNCLTAAEQSELVKLLQRVEQYHYAAFEVADL
ncbi:MAG TPA: MarR family transcriptional regulator [Chitinophagaceae bacterium]|nr:MarR family transcriptional regulator [Chitinophagaceae bacterium]